MAPIFSPRAVLALAAAALMTTTMWASRETQAPAPTEQLTANAIEFFETNVRPVLVESCFTCHTKAEAGGLRVDSRDALLKGGNSGPAIIPGNPDESYLLRAVRHAPNAPKMPKNGPKLSDAQVAALTQWIRDGAPWPTVAAAAPPPPRLATSRSRESSAPSGRFNLCAASKSRRSAAATGRSPLSIDSSWPDSRKKDCRRCAQPTS